MGPAPHLAQGNALITDAPALITDAPAVADNAPAAPPDSDRLVSDRVVSDRVARRRARRAQAQARVHAHGDGTEAIDLSTADMRSLVDAARTGDAVALDDLVRATYGGTFTLAYRLTGNEEDARDVVQDAYLRAYKGLRRFRGDAQFTTWLYRITANCSANLLAKRARNRVETLSEDEPVVDLRPEIDPQLRMAGEDERSQISAALARLPWRLRQVVVLRDIYDLPHGAIARELGISEAAAKVRLHRARRRLRELLATDTDADMDAPASAGAPEVDELIDARAS